MRFFLFSLSLCAVVCSGCATSRTSSTARTGAEQMLISGAVDRALDKFNFSDFQNQAVFLDDKYLDAVDKGYVIGSLRHRLLAAGARLAPAADQADILLEVRSGGIGTDEQDSYIGTPNLAVPGMPLELPEIRVVNRSTQYGTANIALVALDAKTGAALGGGGQALARSDNDHWSVFGLGPFRRGSAVRDLEQMTGSPNGVDLVGSDFRDASGQVYTAQSQTVGLVEDSSDSSDLVR